MKRLLHHWDGDPVLERMQSKPFEFCLQFVRKLRYNPGLLVASMVTQTLSSLLGEGAVHVSQEVAFVAPVHIGDSITVVSEVVEKIDDKRRVVVSTVWTKQDGTTVITGKGEVLIPRDKTGCKE